MALGGKPLRLGFFGNFYPSVSRLGPTSTGLVVLLSRSERVLRIILFGTSESAMPPFARAEKIEIVRSWGIDRPLELIRTGVLMFERRREFDAVVFNVYLTGFGRSWTSNGIGLLVPVFVALAARRPTLVYLHNVVEAQRPEALGYRVGRTRIRIAQFLERLLAATTRLYVPLESQQRALRRSGTQSSSSFVIPYLEGVFGALDRLDGPEPDRRPPVAARPRVLLFGAWGPQKDLAGALESLGTLREQGLAVEVTVAGSVNNNFHHYTRELEQLRRRWGPNGVRFQLGVGESEVAGLLENCDVLFLPYRAAGGYSAVMNLGAMFGVRILAYELPELREFDRLLGAGTLFVPGPDPILIRRAIELALAPADRDHDRGAAGFRARLRRAQAAVDDFAARCRA
ncbi:MAG TPA: hypothetical protein VGV89_04915 [Thermoplasmata archaeon]|nr:hypothetical protein [Thermoplasmata archaeon]